MRQHYRRRAACRAERGLRDAPRRGLARLHLERSPAGPPWDPYWTRHAAADLGHSLSWSPSYATLNRYTPRLR
jgi:hypothetical protein